MVAAARARKTAKKVAAKRARRADPSPPTEPARPPRPRGVPWLAIPSVDRRLEHIGGTRSVWITGLDDLDLTTVEPTFEIPAHATIHEQPFPGAVEIVVFKRWQP